MMFHKSASDRSLLLAKNAIAIKDFTQINPKRVLGDGESCTINTRNCLIMIMEATSFPKDINQEKKELMAQTIFS